MSYTKEDIARATRLLNDPYRFVEYVEMDLFSLEMLGPLFQDQPRLSWKNRDKALRLVKRAVTIPNADVQKLVGRAHDLSTDLVVSVLWRQRAITLAIERLRLDLIKIREELDAPLPADLDAAAELDAAAAELDRLSKTGSER